MRKFVCTRVHTLKHSSWYRESTRRAEKGHSENKKDEKYLHGYKVLRCFISFNLCDSPTKNEIRASRGWWFCSKAHQYLRRSWGWDQSPVLHVWRCLCAQRPTGAWNRIHLAAAQPTGGASHLAPWGTLRHQGLTRWARFPLFFSPI